MPEYIEYEIEEGVTVLVQAGEQAEMGAYKAANKTYGINILASEKKFGEALEGVRRTALAIKHKLEDLRADETEVTFGLKTTGKLGNFAIAEVGVEANFTVTLKWKNKPEATNK